MPAEPSREAAFFAALTAPDGRPPAGLIGPDGTPDAKRLAVYRNTVAATLIEALAASYPAVVRLLGDEFFAAAAGTFATQTKPESPLLFRYGTGFPAFLAEMEALAPYPYIGDVARLDRAYLEAYHAADAAPLTAADLAGVPPEALSDLRLMPHPATRMVTSTYPIVSIWAANRDGGDPLAPLPDHGEDGLVSRPDLDVEVRRLPPGAAAFLAGLTAGMRLAEAAQSAAQASDVFDLSTTLRVLLDAGALAPADPGDREE